MSEDDTKLGNYGFECMKCNYNRLACNNRIFDVIEGNLKLAHRISNFHIDSGGQ